MKIQNWKIDKIIPYDNNPRMNDQSVDAVAESLTKFGWRQPIVVDNDGIVIVGHTRLKAAIKLGMKEVPVHVADLDSTAAKAYRLADNQTAGLSSWNMDLLKLELDELEDLGFDMSGFKFDADVIFNGNEGNTDPDDVPEPPKIAKTKTGDLYILGNHRLLCGDSTKSGDVALLMNGDKADMVFTDPPYNVDYGVSKNPCHKIRSIENDKQSPEQWEQFCKALFAMFRDFSSGDIYMWGASDPEGMRMRLWLTEMGCHWSATIIWKKQQIVLTPANYQRMYEPCFYGWFDKSSFNNKMGSGGDRSESEVWEINRPLNSKLHPTMKPVELCKKGIENSSNAGNIVLDFFLGSGSTLIACEEIGRKCYGVEIDPIYCDVIVKRWEEFTGQKAELVQGVSCG